MPGNHKPRVPTTAQRRLEPWVRNALVPIVVTAVFAAMVPVASASDTSTRWEDFSESSGCGEPFTRGPVMSKTGQLADSEAILGPFGTYFGRSIAEVRTQLRDWTVPYSGGTRVSVHKDMMPALEKVAAGLEAHAAAGRIYEISSAWAFTPRTIGSRYRISRHALGLAIDLNPAQNPYRSDGALITDMPTWFVQTWKDAGFCWGGDWNGVKDSMHFSWMGPGSSGTAALRPDPPDTKKTGFRGPVASHSTQFGTAMWDYEHTIADANSNGTSDVVGVRSHGDGTVIDIATSSLGFGYCSVGRWHVPDPSLANGDHIVMADVDGDSGQDLVVLAASGESMTATTATRRNFYKDVSSLELGASAASVAFAGGDFDGDRHADLWEATNSGTIRIWRGPSFASLLHESPLPDGPPAGIAVGDRDGGDMPELYLLYQSGGGSRLDVLTHTGSWVEEASFGIDNQAGEIEAIGANDYDGDGRADAQILTTSGEMIVYLGNSPTGVPADRWFADPDRDCASPVLLEYQGRFMDDETSIFASDIESIAEAGVTKGCNPPFNDKFCPTDEVSREQMAAFLVRALGLTEDTHSGFTDVPPDSTFARDIGKLATAGITKGCNPPKNDRFCPRDPVSRQQMAAFITRALGLTANTHPGFVDVSVANTFVHDIGKLATAGITKGCNPPENDRFCPDEPVTRGQMAAFLNRSDLGS